MPNDCNIVLSVGCDVVLNLNDENGSNIILSVENESNITLSVDGGGGGTVTNVSVTPNQGVSGAVANASTTPEITISLGAITPISVSGDGSGLTGLTKSQVGLANADNTTDLNKPISTATQTALDLKSNIASPTFTGVVVLPAGQVVNGVTLSTAEGDTKFLRGDGSYEIPSGSSGGGSPGGDDTQVQFNDNGVFNASPDFTWDDTNKFVSVVGGLESTKDVAGVHEAVRLYNNFDNALGRDTAISGHHTNGTTENYKSWRIRGGRWVNGANFGQLHFDIGAHNQWSLSRASLDVNGFFRAASISADATLSANNTVGMHYSLSGVTPGAGLIRHGMWAKDNFDMRLRASGGDFVLMSWDQRFGVGVDDRSQFAAKFAVVANSASILTSAIKAAAAQTANLTEWQNSAGTALTLIDASGNITFGNTSATPTAKSLLGQSGLGTNIAGAALNIAGGKGTGTGATGVVNIQVAPTGASGTTLNDLVTAAQFDASTTATHTRFFIYDVDNATLERVTVGDADSGGVGFKLLRISN